MNNENEENIIPASNIKRPIFVRLFSAFFLLSLLILISTSLFIFYAVKSTTDILTLEEINTIKDNLQNQFIFVVIFILIPSLFLSVWTASNIAEPIRKISKGIKNVVEGNLDTQIHTKRKDELGNLINLFNAMVLRMKELRSRDQELTKMKARFIKVASHQLRTPSSGVGWGLDLLLKESEGSLNEEQKKIVKTCQERNLVTIGLVNDLISAAQIEENDMTYELQEIPIDTLLKKEVDNFYLEAKVKNIEISFENKTEENLKIIADPDRLYTVFSNMIENAIQYSKKDTVIKVLMQKEDNFVLIQIINDGIGIDIEDRARIFTKFFRGENALSQKPNGSGLGLFISQKIIAYHKGKITFDSDENGRTTFSIYIPIHQELISKKSKTEEFLETI